MPSRLSSLLVRDGLVGVKRMEKAYQRQVIYGGTLDTILLEMNLLSEDRLIQYLALASGLPPAAREEGATVDPAASAAVPPELAERFHAVPVAFDGEALRVLVCAPLEIGELEDLADRLDRALQPLIVPEYRWHLAFAVAYGIDPPARFTTLARMLAVDPSTPAVGRAPSVIIEDPRRAAPGAVAAEAAAAPTAPVSAGPAIPLPAPAGPGEATLPAPDGGPAAPEPAPAPATRASAPDDPLAAPPGTPAPPVLPSGPGRPGPAGPATPVRYSIPAPGTSAPLGPRADEPARGRRHTMIGVQPNRATTDSIPVVRIPDPRPRDAGPGREGSPRRSARALTPPLLTQGRDSPIPVVRARELLATAQDRDTVFLTLLRAVRGRARWAGLLTVQGGAAIGRAALAEPGIDVAGVTAVLIPLDVVSPFRNVVSNHQPHIGPLISGDAGIDAMVLRLGGTLPPSALILPVVLRDRVVAIVVAHRVYSDIRLVDVAELLPMATAASDALGRLIVQHKATESRAQTDAAPAIEVEAELIDTRRLARPDPEVPGASEARDASDTSDASDARDRRDGRAATAASGGVAAPAAGGSLPGLELGTELSIDAEPPVPIDDLLSAIESAPEGGAEESLHEAVARAPEAIAALARRFPGKLRVDRFAVTGRGMRAPQYGGLLELVTRLGAAASELLVDKLAAPHRDVRFYATACAAELRPRSAVFALAERLFDHDFGVRALALEALAGYPAADLAHALARVRRAVHATDPEVVDAAAHAIVQLGDVDAIADLIGAIERGDRSAEHARRALVALTAQDFASSERKWRKWWEGARGRHRIEWLIEGLGHRDDALRESAIRELRRLTGEHFGYYHDLPRRDRDAAAERWAAWWREAGRLRFLSPAARASGTADERRRPTAKLPPRE
jgi:hypothetical protein